jgi:cyclopropane fatty-acyl-phospholipid synthase-like methyltransferase
MFAVSEFVPRLKDMPRTPETSDISESLTTQQYWQSYYTGTDERSEIERICGEYNAIWEILINSCERKPENIIEIGAYPGRFLAYLASRYGLRATALDFNPDFATFERTMSLMRVKNFQYINEDFIEFNPRERYDLVLSIGFIEHFNHFDEVMDLHCNYLKPGGAMLIMVPHMRYGQYIHRRIFDRENLEIHNRKCMKKSVFRRFAKRNRLKIQHLSYFGGFLTNVHKPLNGWKDIGNRIERRAFRLVNPILTKFPSALYSSTLIGIFTPDSAY